MAEAEWGAKRSCPSCAVRFYDLMKDPAVCPSCGESFPLASLSERKSTSSAASRRAPKAAVAARTDAASGSAPRGSFFA